MDLVTPTWDPFIYVLWLFDESIVIAIVCQLPALISLVASYAGLSELTFSDWLFPTWVEISICLSLPIQVKKLLFSVTPFAIPGLYEELLQSGFMVYIRVKSLSKFSELSCWITILSFVPSKENPPSAEELYVAPLINPWL